MIAIKRGNGELIWMDAVLSFQESYSSSVTKHQVESGSSISDHIIENNPTISLNGVVSAVEFNGGVEFTRLSPDALSELKVTSQFNADFQPTFVSVGSSFKNPIIKLLPDSLRQFLDNDGPADVQMGVTIGLPETIKNIKEKLISLNSGFLKDGVRIKEVVTLVEFDSNFSVFGTYEDCVCTSISFSQDPDSGDALYPQMSFEKVRFVGITKTTLPKNSSAKGNTNKNQKGKQEPKKTSECEAVDPKTSPTSPGVAGVKDGAPKAVEKSQLKQNIEGVKPVGVFPL